MGEGRPRRDKVPAGEAGQAQIKQEKNLPSASQLGVGDDHQLLSLKKRQGHGFEHLKYQSKTIFGKLSPGWAESLVSEEMAEFLISQG